MDKKEEGSLPKGWIAKTSRKRCVNEVYYCHPESGISVWTKEEVKKVEEKWKEKRKQKNEKKEAVENLTKKLDATSNRKYKKAVRRIKKTVDMTQKTDLVKQKTSSLKRSSCTETEFSENQQCKNLQPSLKEKIPKKLRTVPDASDIKNVNNLQRGAEQTNRNISSSKNSVNKKQKSHYLTLKTDKKGSEVPLPLASDKVSFNLKTAQLQFALAEKRIEDSLQLGKKKPLKAAIAEKVRNSFSNFNERRNENLNCASTKSNVTAKKPDTKKRFRFNSVNTSKTKDSECYSKMSKKSEQPAGPSSSKSGENIAIEYMEYTDERDDDDDVIMVDLQEIRGQISSSRNAVVGDLTKALQSSDSKSQTCFSQKALYIIVDTCVLIKALNVLHTILYVDYCTGKQFDIFIVIPWLVLQELDVLKDNKLKRKSNSLVKKCQQAVIFINKMLLSKHPRFIGQTAKDAFKVSDFRIEVNDDRILLCCFQFAEKGSSKVILLSNDRNLINKAEVNGFEGHTSETIHEALQHFQEARLPTLICNETKSHNVSHSSEPADRQIVNNILPSLKTCLKTALEVCLEAEMKSAYGDLWFKVIWRKPPWTLEDILNCFSKHWIAVFSFFLKKKEQAIIEALNLLFKKEKVISFKPDSLLQLIDDCLYLLQIIEHHSTYGETIPKCLETLGCLRQSVETDSQEKTSELTLESETLSNTKNEQDYQQLAMNEFQLVWENINYYCGLICDSLNFPHQLTFKRPEILPSAEESVQFATKLFLVVYTLCEELKSVVDAVCCNSNMLSVSTTKLYQSLVNFSANVNVQNEQSSETNLTPDMLLSFCQHPDKRELIINGHQQLVNFLSLLQQCILHSTGKLLTPEVRAF